MLSTGAWSSIGGATPRLHHELDLANCSRRDGTAGVVSPTRRALVAREGDFPTGTRVRLRCLCQVAAERRQGLGTSKDADRRSAEPDAQAAWRRCRKPRKMISPRRTGATISVPGMESAINKATNAAAARTTPASSRRSPATSGLPRSPRLRASAESKAAATITMMPARGGRISQKNATIGSGPTAIIMSPATRDRRRRTAMPPSISSPPAAMRAPPAMLPGLPPSSNGMATPNRTSKRPTRAASTSHQFLAGFATRVVLPVRAADPVLPRTEGVASEDPLASRRSCAAGSRAPPPVPALPPCAPRRAVPTSRRPARPGVGRRPRRAGGGCSSPPTRPRAPPCGRRCSCRLQPRPGRRLAVFGLPGGQDAFAGAGHRIQSPPRSSFGGGGVRVLPLAFEQARLLEPLQCLVEGAVGGEWPRAGVVGDRLGELEAVEAGSAGPAQLQAGLEDVDLEGEQGSWPAAHDRRIGRYLPSVKRGHSYHPPQPSQPRGGSRRVRKLG